MLFVAWSIVIASTNICFTEAVQLLVHALLYVMRVFGSRLAFFILLGCFLKLFVGIELMLR
jgi:hypothetical protein